MIEVTAVTGMVQVRDAGRVGYRHVGIPLSGAADPWSYRLSNVLADNAPGAACLEGTMARVTLMPRQSLLFAVTGAATLHVGDRPVPTGRPVTCPAYESLSIAVTSHGARWYLSVAGGVAVPEVYGSRTTWLPGRLGGLEGRALRRGDRLALGEVSPWARERLKETQGRLWHPKWHAKAHAPRAAAVAIVGAMPGPEWEGVPRRSRDVWWRREFRVLADSDSMGIRLRAEVPVGAPAADRPSAPVNPGTVQLPPSGEPIALLSDAPTVGGYPRILQVIQADWPVLAQAVPGASVRFIPRSLEEARSLLRRQESSLEVLATTLRELAR